MVSFKEHAKTLAKLDVAALVLMHAANKVISSFSTSKNMLKPGTGKYFQWKYGDVFYHKIGEGSPVVLLHNVDPSDSGYEWFDVIDALSKDHTVYTVDLPGCGRSAKPKITYTNFFYVIFVRDFIKGVVKSKADVIADRYSSSFAIMAAAMDPAIIHHITAVNPYSLGNLGQTETRRSKVGKILLSLPVLGTTIYNMEVSHRNIDYKFTEDYLYNPFRGNDRYIDAYYEGAHYHDNDGKYLLASIKGLYMTVNIRNSLPKLEDKFTILYGEGIDHAADIISEYKTLNPKVRAYAIPKTKYIPMMECPKEFMTVLKKSAER